MKKESIVGLKELRSNVQKYILRVENGESLIVVRRSLPIFKISPPETEESWEEVIDFTKIKKGGVELKDILSRL